MNSQQSLNKESDSATSGRARLISLYQNVRDTTESLTKHLSPEDQVIQSMPDASPVKWHRGHTSWFFETFVLKNLKGNYKSFHPQFEYIFNSYYEAIGARHPRPDRGLLTRPTSREVKSYRSHIDENMAELIAYADEDDWKDIGPLIELGCHHEQQHQELLLMDILHAFSCNPLQPAYQPQKPTQSTQSPPLSWIDFEGGTYEIGHSGGLFSFDNERPKHTLNLRPWRLASRLVTNGEWKDFINDDGYHRPELWLSDGWTSVQEKGWKAPLYWNSGEHNWKNITLLGPIEVCDYNPVCHISYYEAEAFARWSKKRLPTEGEWEVASSVVSLSGNFLENRNLQPIAAPTVAGLLQMYGDVWEFTQSPYMPYPGFKASNGAVGEYNGKFMINQMVLRGGSCITPHDHVRNTYRNFFYPHMRWQFGGLRLAEDV